MKRRVRASVKTRKALEDLFSGRGYGGKSDLVKLASRLILEEALEGEVQDRVGREYYAHGAKAGHRNGYRRGRLDTSEGRIEFAVPQVRGTVQPYRSEIRRALAGGRTEELERLAIEMYARGLSVRDIERTFTDRRGECLLSKSAVSELSERLWADYQAFAGRDLSDFDVLYLFVDGIAEKLHLGQPREAVLAAWGITREGQKVLLGLAPGSKEDTACGRDFLRDLKARGLCDPILVASDGAPGLIRAVEEVFPRSLRQRCLAHKIRNLEAKVPAERWRELKAMALAAYQAASPLLAELAKEEFVKRFERELPSATACFLDDFAACAAQLRLPIAHRRAIRTTNFARTSLRRRVSAHQGDPARLR